MLDAYKEREGDWNLISKTFWNYCALEESSAVPPAMSWTAVICCAVRKNRSSVTADWWPSTFRKRGPMLLLNIFRKDLDAIGFSMRLRSTSGPESITQDVSGV